MLSSYSCYIHYELHQHMLAECCQVGIIETACSPLDVTGCESKRHRNKTCYLIVSTVISPLSQCSSTLLFLLMALIQS